MTPKPHPIRAMRRAGVPLAAFETPDPAATINSCIAALNGKQDGIPIIEWDIVNGWRGRNKAGEESLSWYDRLSQPLPDSLERMAGPGNVPGGTLAFIHNVHRIIDRDGVVQGIWNLRDAWKANGSLLCLVGPALTLPAELRQDVVTIVEPMPNAEEIGTVVDEVIKAAMDKGAILAPDWGRERAVDTLLGLSSFLCEQALAMNVSKAGVDFDGLWSRKVIMIEQTQGLSVQKGGDRFSDIGGCDNVKGFCSAVLRGRNSPLTICFIDEIEKSIGGAGDLSGVSQDYLKTLLTYMQDTEAAGMIFVGPPGAAKSAVAKAAGNEAGIPTIALDLGAMRGSLVGQSEMQLRAALKVIDAVSQKRTLFIATCNSLGVLPPELKRRFTLGTFYFDLPTLEERAAIWAIYRKAYSIDDADLPPEDKDWTGAEIKQCCNIAWRLNKPLFYAAQFIVPVAKAAAEKIKELRSQASGKFISANKAGVYEFKQAAPQGRSLEL